jgi:hypothetical protein
MWELSISIKASDIEVAKFVYQSLKSCAEEVGAVVTCFEQFDNIYIVIACPTCQKSKFFIAKNLTDPIVFQPAESNDTLQVYSFPFVLRTHHQLIPNGYSTQYKIQTLGASSLPFCTGWGILSFAVSSMTGSIRE